MQTQTTQKRWEASLAHAIQSLVARTPIRFSLAWMASVLQLIQTAAAGSAAPESFARQNLQALYEHTWDHLPQPVRSALSPQPQLVVTTQPQASSLFSMQKGAYDPDTNQLKISADPLSPAEDLGRTFLHEWGHALALRRMSAESVCRFAVELGPWPRLNKPCAQIVSHLDPALFAPHSFRDAPKAILTHSGRIPSRYALASAHEYIAETFAEWLMRGPAVDRALHKAWTSLIDRANQQEQCQSCKPE